MAEHSPRYPLQILKAFKLIYKALSVEGNAFFIVRALKYLMKSRNFENDVGKAGTTLCLSA